MSTFETLPITKEEKETLKDFYDVELHENATIRKENHNRTIGAMDAAVAGAKAFPEFNLF